MSKASSARQRLLAFGSGEDLSRRARLLSDVHDAVMSGRTPPVPPRDVVARSWSRLRADGVSPARCEDVVLADTSELEARRARSALRSVLPELRGTLTEVASDANFIVVVADSDGVVLWREGARDVQREADVLGFVEGARWSEKSVGTNSVGTSLVEDAPVQLFSAEHYARSHYGWSCTGSPVHDPRSGEVLGVLDISGSAMSVHPATVALVQTAVRLAESMLWREHAAHLDRLRADAAPVLAATCGPAVVVDGHGWVVAASGIGVPERLAPPGGDRPLLVPGLGLCVPEPLGDAWLVRRRAERAAVELELDLGAAPRATVRGETEWTRALSPRHAQILRVLARTRSAGIDAASLSEALFGDRDHIVAVRAEVSRLRKSLGPVLTPQPYRFADGVEVRVVR
ncbi:GAF domain-containing protein [Rhodococcus ruber]|uniref:Transcriptional regulator n=1 Tax=Rhodococcus ruber TaxID=1830 RepID=A0A098BS49_9NOCA|nr:MULTISPECIES: GAF domain-containing protein [Rhodococcus]ATQ29363.1 diguanylate cyclase [Rhodococcus ruber]MCD2128623.1 GAF domain-containing protein [Rhodococcus ruber]MCZ1072894.1 GAF domain-containing protein [Rhodococcus sp. A5(2022)]MCZ4504895.1 GAF domain-containing protein [Rhodococcus ruber]MCZ4531672.1 GAF domain-containing protein [Rhodococcus ruber]